MSQQGMCPKQVGFYPEMAEPTEQAGPNMNIILSARMECKANISAWEMYRVNPAQTGWVEVLRPVAGAPGMTYRVVHRTFMAAVSNTGFQRVHLAIPLPVERSDVLAVRPINTKQFIHNREDLTRLLNWPNRNCQNHLRPNANGTPADIARCWNRHRKFALRAILN